MNSRQVKQLIYNVRRDLKGHPISFAEWDVKSWEPLIARTHGEARLDCYVITQAAKKEIAYYNFIGKEVVVTQTSRFPSVKRTPSFVA